MLNVKYKKVLIQILCFCTLTNSVAFSAPPPPESDSLNYTQEEFKRDAQAQKNNPYVFRRLGEKIINANEKISKNAITRGGKNLFVKATATYLTTLVALTAKEVIQRLSDENLEITPENVSNKVQEIQQTWDDTQKSLFETADASFLWFPTKGMELLTGKFLPSLSERTFAGQALNAFVIGLIFSGAMALVDENILLACRYLIEHQYDQPSNAKQDPLAYHLPTGPLTNDELKAVTLLQSRVGLSYFSYGFLRGGPVTKSAYRKVAATLNYIFWKEDALRDTIWSHVWQASILSGSSITSFTFISLAGSLRSKIISDTVKYASIRKTGYTIVAYTLAKILIPDWINDQGTYMARYLWSKNFGSPLKQLNSIQSEVSMGELFAKARETRESIVNTNFPVVLIAIDKIEKISARQKTLYEKLNSNPSPQLKLRLENSLSEGASDLTFYQRLIMKSMDIILETYNKDLNFLKESTQSTASLAKIVRNEYTSVFKTASYLRYFKDTLINQYNSKNPTYASDSETYSTVMQLLTQQSYWGFFENGI